ncbi:MAG: small basic protein [Candidatus Omnitrophica bacterium]|nr:small basic protein [Candidatus Omnitrophota bacterium]
MSLHSSLKIDVAGAQQRTVLSRIERIKELMKKGIWEQTGRVTGLPKTKIVRLKTRKAKSEKAAEGAAATPAAAGAAKPAAGKAAKA